MGNFCSNLKDKIDRRYVGENEVKLKSAIEILKEEKYKFKKKIGCGSFGDVIEVHFEGNKKSKFAAKIVTYRSSGELELWKSFRHENITPLLNTIQHNNIIIFLMPLHKKTLAATLYEKSFRKDPESFNLTKKWLTDVLSGLQYLHNLNICHLDIKSDNILITAGKTAVICDFTLSCEMAGNIINYGVSHLYRPPEVYAFVPIQGKSFDIWSLGMLAVFTWIRVWADVAILTIECWQTIVYPFMFDCLQEPKFEEFVKMYYPKASITPDEISQALNLIQGVLRYRAENRPEANIILQHPLLHDEKREENMLEVDLIWINRYHHLQSYVERNDCDITDTSSSFKSKKSEESSFENLFTEEEKGNDKYFSQLSSIEERNENMPMDKNIRNISDLCYSHIQYLGYSILHEICLAL